jgi:predicted DCC family thiol-disulfide oxidoreductase YuxK
VNRSTTAPYSYRHDSAVPAFDDTAPIVIFDGKCVLCSRFVQFALRHDRLERLRFLAAQTELGEALYATLGLRSGDFDTYVLLENGRARVKSDAALRIFAMLGFPWALLCVGRVIPRYLRDTLYDWIARNRLRWFGARETCYTPTLAERSRFIA